LPEASMQRFIVSGFGLTSMAKTLRRSAAVCIRRLKEPTSRKPSDFIWGGSREKSRKAQGVDMALDDGYALQRNTRDRLSGGEGPRRVAKDRFAMWGALTQGEAQSHRFATCILAAKRAVPWRLSVKLMSRRPSKGSEDALLP
jgi:hypothetical protein